MPTISVVIPVFNEEENLTPLYERLRKSLESLEGFTYEIIFVDDGSRDRSLAVIKSLGEKDEAVRYVSFSRNFGHEAATTAGFERASGDCVVLIDADLQDPPEVIIEMVEKWKEGYEVVYAQRRKRPGEGIFKKATSFLFYRLINIISPQKLPVDTGDFRLVDRRVLQALYTMGEYNRMIRAMIAWLGFRNTGILYEREERFRGKTKYNFIKLLWLSLDAMTGFSIVPLRISIAIGFIVMTLSFLGGCAVLYHKLFLGLSIQGYALQTIGLFFLGGIQLFILGIMGEYVGKTYLQSLKRPIYVISREGGFDKVNEESPLR
ncbi:MAG: glycosyltransferase family 2 protein [Vulcanimicrobiota bacterium]